MGAIELRPPKKSAVKGPLASFYTTAKKIERQIAYLREGGDIGGNFSEQRLAVSKAIGRLEDRASKPEIRGDAALAEEAYAVVKALRAANIASEAIGLAARQSARGKQISSLKEKERDRILDMSPSQRADYQYQQELALMRARRG